jgi:hypothetical protein
LEAIEERSFARLERAIEHGNPLTVKSCQEFYLRCSETLRRLDLAVEIERRNAVELIPRKQVETVSLFLAEWLRIAIAQFLSSESRSLMGIKDPKEFRLYAIDRFRGIVYAAVKTSRKTNSPIPTWAESKGDRSLEWACSMNRNSRRKAKAELKLRRANGEKLTNPKSKRRSAWWGGISKRVPVKSL